MAWKRLRTKQAMIGHMPSQARQDLDQALADVDAQIEHAKSFSKGARGAPAAHDGRSKPGRPFTRAGVVMLSAAVEGYVESLVMETGTALLLSPAQQKDIKEQVGRSHGMNVHHVHHLTAMVGLPFVVDNVGWRGLPLGTARKLLSELARARNQIAHGRPPAKAQVTDLERWRNLVARLCDQLDEKAAAHVKDVTGKAPW